MFTNEMVSLALLLAGLGILFLGLGMFFRGLSKFVQVDGGHGFFRHKK